MKVVGKLVQTRIGSEFVVGVEKMQNVWMFVRWDTDATLENWANLFRFFSKLDIGLKFPLSHAGEVLKTFVCETSIASNVIFWLRFCVLYKGQAILGNNEEYTKWSANNKQAKQQVTKKMQYAVDVFPNHQNWKSVILKPESNERRTLKDSTYMFIT